MLKPAIDSFGEKAVLLKWPKVIDSEMHSEILAWEKLIKANFKHDLIDSVTTYAEIALYFKSSSPINAIKNWIDEVEIENILIHEKKNTKWLIPVCYESEFGLDTEIVAEHNNMTVDQVINLHRAQPYRIYFTGFLPGFLYLGGLPEKICTPRKKTPRLQIPQGAIAIGGSQTGIYPTVSPGGWQIIGQTPIQLFNSAAAIPSPFLPGDFVQFEAITRKELDEITLSLSNGAYHIKKLMHQ